MPGIDTFPGAARMGHSLRSKPSMRLHQHVSSHLWECQEQHTPWPLEQLGHGLFLEMSCNVFFCHLYTVYVLAMSYMLFLRKYMIWWYVHIYIDIIVRYIHKYKIWTQFRYISISRSHCLPRSPSPYYGEDGGKVMLRIHVILWQFYIAPCTLTYTVCAQFYLSPL